MDIELGLCCLRAPAWCQFKLQFYCNSHSWLARQLIAIGIGFCHGFIRVDDSDRIQQLADSFQSDDLHRIPDPYVNQCCCQVFHVFEQRYY